MKKRNFIIVIGILSVLVFASTKIFDEKQIKARIFKMVENNAEIILNDIKKRDFSKTLKLAQIESVKYVEGDIDFYCGGYGIVPSSQEYGFYYSNDGLPKGIWCGTKYCESNILNEDNNGYSTNAYNNYYYTEKITSNFYYYEVFFETFRDGQWGRQTV